MDRDDVIDTLNGLIETSRDGENGFRTCVENAKSATLKTFFLGKAERCREGALQLQQIVREMGGAAETDSSFSGDMHRFWMNIKSSIAGMDDHQILAECEKGEDSAKQAYREALALGLQGDVRMVVERQYREVMANHDRVKELRNITA